MKQEALKPNCSYFPIFSTEAEVFNCFPKKTLKKIKSFTNKGKAKNVLKKLFLTKIKLTEINQNWSKLSIING